PFGLALIVWGLPIALVAPRPYLAGSLVLLALVGAANSVEDIAGFTLLQRVVPDELLTRVLGVVWGLAMGSLALGSITATAVVRHRPDHPGACRGARGVAKEYLAATLTRVAVDAGDVVIRAGDVG